MLNSASQTNRLSGRAQRMLEKTTAPITSTPPMVGVPCFAPCSSASRWTSAAPRIGCSTFSARNFAIMKFPKIKGSQKCSDRRSNGPEGDVKKNVEPDEVATQVMEVVHHGEVTNAEF